MIHEFRLVAGKHAGKTISDPDVSLSHIKWIEETWFLSKSQRESVNFEIKRREGSTEGRVVRRPRND